MKEIIKRLAQGGEEIYAKICEVISVDAENKTVDLKPLDGTAEILDALVQVDDKGVFIQPKIKSLVVCVFVTKEIAVVVNHSEVDLFSVQIEDCEMSVTKDLIKLYSDSFGGLVKVKELTKKINRLENKLNSLITKYNTHIHVTTATISASPVPGVITPPVTPETPIVPITNRKDIENEKVNTEDK